MPGKCPKCLMDLTQEGTIKVWEYQDQSRFAHVLDGGIEWEMDQPQSGESWLMISYECHACGHTLAEARSEELCSESLGQEMEDFFAMKGEKHTLVQKLLTMRKAVELAKEMLGRYLPEDLTAEGDEPVNHIEVLRHHLIGGWQYTLDLVENLCKRVVETEVEDGPRPVSE